jgi:hypothetical protein
MELPAREIECDKPSEQPESGAVPARPVEIGNKDPKETPSQDSSDLKQILTGIMEVIRADLGAKNEKIQRLQESNRADLSSVKTDLSANNEKIQHLQESVKTYLSSVKANISSKFSQLHEANTKYQENLRAKTKAGNEKLIKSFELQSQQSNKEFLAWLDSESRRLTNLVGQVQKETESELVAVKRQLQVVSTGFETRLEQSSTHTQGIINELASQMVDHRSGVEATISKLDQDVSHRLTRQRESIDKTNQIVNQAKSATESRLEQMNAKIVALESKIADAPSRAAFAVESHATSNILLSPSVVNQNDPSSDIGSTTSHSVPTNKNHACSCQSGNTCNVCVRACGGTTEMNGPIESLSVSE